MNIIQLENKCFLSNVVLIRDGWLISSMMRNFYYFVVKCNGNHKKYDGNIYIDIDDKIKVRTKKDGLITSAGIDEFGNVTSSENATAKIEKNENYEYYIFPIRDVLSKWLKIKDDEIGILFYNKNTQSNRILAIPKIFESDEDGNYEFNVEFSYDGQTVLMYQNRFSEKHKVIILDNPVCE